MALKVFRFVLTEVGDDVAGTEEEDSGSSDAAAGCFVEEVGVFEVGGIGSLIVSPPVALGRGGIGGSLEAGGFGGFGGLTGDLPFQTEEALDSWLLPLLPVLVSINGFGFGGTGGLAKTFFVSKMGLIDCSCLISGDPGALHTEKPGVPTVVGELTTVGGD